MNTSVRCCLVALVGLLLSLLLVNGTALSMESTSPTLVVVKPLSLAPLNPNAGQIITASFTVRNDGAASITLDRIGVGGRGPGCSDFACTTSFRDFELVSGVTIGPGQTYTYQKSRSFPEAGVHFAQVVYEQQPDNWYFMGSRIDFTVSPGLVVSEPLALSTTNPTTKDLVFANFELRNDGNTPLTLLKVGIGGRGPNCAAGDWGCQSYADFPWVENVTLLPGQSNRFSSWRIYGTPGTHFAQLSIQDSQGVWNNIGTLFDISVNQATYDQRSTPLPFGIQWHPTWDEPTDSRELALAAGVGAKTLRLGVSWRLLEQSGKGNWDTTWYIPALRRLIEVANWHGIEVHMMLLQVPCWASSDPNKDCDSAVSWDDAYPPINHQDYADVFTKLVDMYGDRVNIWEVWNEPNIVRFWKPAPDAVAYSHLLKLAHDAIKAAQPHAVVLGGSLAGADIVFLDAMYRAGAKTNFDALALHPYSGTRAPDDCADTQWSFVCAIDAARSMMLYHSDPKPMYLTEFGWSSYSGQGGVSEDTQMQYLQQALQALEVREFVTSMAWYTLVDTNCPLPPDLLHDNDFGLFSTSHRAKPAAIWLQVLQRGVYMIYLSTVIH